MAVPAAVPMVAVAVTIVLIGFRRFQGTDAERRDQAEAEENGNSGKDHHGHSLLTVPGGRQWARETPIRKVPSRKRPGTKFQFYEGRP